MTTSLCDSKQETICLQSKDVIKFSNLVTQKVLTTPTRCTTCYNSRYYDGGISSCRHVGEPGHSSRVTCTEMTVSSGSCLKNVRGNWVLTADVCLYSSVLHLKFNLSQGKTNEMAKLELTFDPCPTEVGREDLPSKILACVVKLKFFKDNEWVTTKYLSTVKKTPDSWKDLTVTNTCFCTQDMIRKLICVGSKELKGRPSDFEYIDAELEVKLTLDQTVQLWQPSGTCGKSGDTRRREFLIRHQDCVKLDEGIDSTPSPPPPLKKSRMDHSSTSTATMSKFQPIFSSSSPPTKLSTSSKSKFSSVVTLQVGSGLTERQYFVYKATLCDHSPVFACMFDVDMVEKKTNQVTMLDVSAEAVETFLEFLEGDETPNIPKFFDEPFLILEVLSLAHQYEMQRLMERIIECIIETPQELLNIQLAINIFEAGNRFKISDLEFRAIQWIQVNREKVLSNEGRKEMEKFVRNTGGVFTAIFEWLF